MATDDLDSPDPAEQMTFSSDWKVVSKEHFSS